MKKERFDAYSNYYYKVNKKQNRKAKILTILFVLFSLSIVVFFSISFSNFLTIAKIVNVNSNYIFENKTLYGISLKTLNNMTNAKEESEKIKLQGGAGFIFNTSLNEYKILSSIYPTEQDAKTVQNNLEKDGIKCEIVSIVLPAFNFKVNLSSKNTEILTKNINIFYTSYKRLYDLSLEYDSNKIDLTQLKICLNELYKNNKDIINKFNDTFKNASNVYILYVKIYLQRINNMILNLINMDESFNYTCEIKYTYCNILYSYLELNKEML